MTKGSINQTSLLDQANDIFNPDEFLKNVAVDNVIFGYHEKELKVLLQRPSGISKWTLTGGYIKKTESINDAAVRVAQIRTGLTNLFLQQFRSFGTPQRVKDPELTPESYSKRLGIELSAAHWVFDYYVSVGFYTLTEFSLVQIEKGPYDEDIRWWPIEELPALMFDHDEIITEALKALQIHIYHHPVGYELLPEKFTLPEIHSLYETILGKSLDSRNFARKITASGIVKKLNETRSIGAHRSPFLYKFDKRKYDAALKEGMFLAF
jgi:ADP-ribose pyrophosphatase YjhB (NUDIX family)